MMRIPCPCASNAMFEQNVINIHTHLLKHYENTSVLIFLDISCSGSGWSLVEWCIVTLLGGGEYIWASGIYPGTLDQRMIWLWCADRLLFISTDPLILYLGTLSCNSSLRKWTFSTHLVIFRLGKQEMTQLFENPQMLDLIYLAFPLIPAVKLTIRSGLKMCLWQNLANNSRGLLVELQNTQRREGAGGIPK